MPERSKGLKRWLAQERPMADALTALLLVPLGVVLAIWAIGERAFLGERFLYFEATAVGVALAGLLALAIGACRVFGLVFSLTRCDPCMLEDEDLPTLIHGVPFAVAAAACLTLMVMLPTNDRYEELGTDLLIATVIGLVFSLLVPLAVGIARALGFGDSGLEE